MKGLTPQDAGHAAQRADYVERLTEVDVPLVPVGRPVHAGAPGMGQSAEVIAEHTYDTRHQGVGSDITSAVKRDDDVVGLSGLHLLRRDKAVDTLSSMLQDPGGARLLAISPHLDGAVLSLGACITQAVQDGAKVTVFTLFAGTAPPPYSAAAERMHAIWGFAPDQDAPLHRREEDIAALNHLGAGYRHGRFLDSIYRKLPDGEWLAEHVAGGQKLAMRQSAPKSDRDLVAAITDDITLAIEECDPTLLVTCAAIGGHPDHEMARDASLFAAREKNVPIQLWEDMPYALMRPDTVELPEGFQLGSPDFSSVSAEVQGRKFHAVEQYTSQLPMLDGKDNNLFARLDKHARKNSPHGGYGETTWSVVAEGAG